MNSDQEILSWLMDSDPSIRWQVMKDIQGLDENIYIKDRQDLSSKGWSSQLLHLQATLLSHYGHML